MRLFAYFKYTYDDKVLPISCECTVIYSPCSTLHAALSNALYYN